jgi:hypothetical protein
MFDLIVVSAVLGVALAVAWPKSERDQAAAAFAQSYCAHNPRAEACSPGGNAYDVLKPFIGLTEPSPTPGAGR